MGAGKWRPEYNPYFEGKQVVILPDNDEVGRKHAQQVARQLHGLASSVKVLELPGLPEKGDVSDWLEAGGTAEELLALVEKVPAWQPSGNLPGEAKKGRTGSKTQSISRGGLRAVGPDDDPELVPVKAALPVAPVGDGLVVPEGWSLTTQGVGKHIKRHDGPDVIKIAPNPIVITGRLSNIADGTESAKLAWPRDGEWRQRTVDRLVIANTRAITELASMGAPVTSRNASDLVQFFADFEATNLRNLPRALVSQQMGWQGEGGRLGSAVPGSTSPLCLIASTNSWCNSVLNPRPLSGPGMIAAGWRRVKTAGRSRCGSTVSRPGPLPFGARPSKRWRRVTDDMITNR